VSKRSVNVSLYSDPDLFPVREPLGLFLSVKGHHASNAVKLVPEPQPGRNVCVLITAYCKLHYSSKVSSTKH